MGVSGHTALGREVGGSNQKGDESDTFRNRLGESVG